MMTSIRSRLALLYAIVFGLSLLLGNLLVYLGLERYLAAELDAALVSQAGEIAGTTRFELGVGPSGTRFLSVVLPNLNVFAAPNLFVQVLGRTGQPQARSSNLGEAELPISDAALARALA